MPHDDARNQSDASSLSVGLGLGLSRDIQASVNNRALSHRLVLHGMDVANKRW